MADESDLTIQILRQIQAKLGEHDQRFEAIDLAVDVAATGVRLEVDALDTPHLAQIARRVVGCPSVIAVVRWERDRAIERVRIAGEACLTQQGCGHGTLRDHSDRRVLHVALRRAGFPVVRDLRRAVVRRETNR